MAFTLNEILKLEEDALAKGIMANILREANLMQYLMFENVSALKNIVVRWASLPSSSPFRKLNAGFTQSSGKLEQVEESVYIMGGKIASDRVYQKVGNLIENPLITDIKMKTKAMSMYWNDYLVNGDHASDEDGFEGMKKRLTLMPARQTIQVNSGATLDPTSSTANARKMLDQLNLAFKRCNGGNVNMILGNEDMTWALTKLYNYLNISGAVVFDTTKDAFDRDVETYRGRPLVDAGYKVDQTTEIITDTEDSGDAGNDSTSMYFVSSNKEQGLIGIQLGNMEVFDPNTGGSNTSSQNEREFEWPTGLAAFGSYGFTRLYGIKAADSWT